MKRWLSPLLLLIFATRCFGSSVDITTNRVPNGTVGTAYSAVVTATGGCTPYVWSTVSGELPAGITATPSSSTTSLTLSGTPTTAATYSFTVQVKGCGGHTSNETYTAVIQGAANAIVDLSWKPSSSNDVTGYNIYRAPDEVNWTKLNVSPIGSTLYTDSTVANGSTYYYAATAVNVNGEESAKTTPVKAVIP